MEFLQDIEIRHKLQILLNNKAKINTLINMKK